MQCRNFKFSPCRKHHMSPRPGDILGPSAKISFSQRRRAPWPFGRVCGGGGYTYVPTITVYVKLLHSRLMTYVE